MVQGKMNCYVVCVLFTDRAMKTTSSKAIRQKYSSYTRKNELIVTVLQINLTWEVVVTLKLC